MPKNRAEPSRAHPAALVDRAAHGDEPRRFVIFSQSGPPNTALLVADKQRLFAATLRADVLTQADQATAVRLSADELEPLLLTWRTATDLDWQAADLAEQRGQAAGMASLARRCTLVWELPAPLEPAPAFWRLCAALAAIALGPVLPPEQHTLYGIRSALKRARES